jgi:hypothetical protein
MLDEEPALANVRNESGATPLHVALPHPEIVQLLLERGADPDAATGATTPSLSTSPRGVRRSRRSGRCSTADRTCTAPATCTRST